MFNFENQVCDVCGKPFDKGSDVVVCPECGTPHHRDCWNNLGHCVNRDKHESGYEWKPVVHEPNPDEIKCPNCGSIMPKDTKFCENCGHAMKQSSEPEMTVVKAPYGMDDDEVRARVERELAGNIDGIPYKDIAIYMGPNAQYYVYKFKRMDDNPNYHPFNWTAFFFTPIWYLFRKMWKLALMAAVVNFCLNIPSLIVMAVQMGQLSASSPLVFKGIETVITVTPILAMAFNLVMGFAAVPLYRKTTVKHLKEMRDKAPDLDAYYRELVRQAGPSKVGMVVVVLYAMMYIFNFFMMPF